MTTPANPLLPSLYFLLALCLIGSNPAPLAAQKPQPRGTLGEGTALVDKPDALAFSPDGKLLGVAHRARIGVFDVATRKMVTEFEAHKYEPESHTTLVFSPDGTTLATSIAKKIEPQSLIRLWRVGTYEKIREWDGTAARSLAFDVSGKFLATTAPACEAAVWNVETGKHAFNLGGMNPAHVVAFNPAGKTVATLSHKGIALWDINAAKGQRLRLFITSTGKYSMFPSAVAKAPEQKGAPTVHSSLSLTSLAFSPDGKFLACGGIDKGCNQVELWDLTEQTAIKTFSDDDQIRVTGQIQRVIFSPSGKAVLTGASHKVAGWDVETGRALFALEAPAGPGDKAAPSPFARIALSADGRTLAAAGAVVPIRLWELPASFVQASVTQQAAKPAEPNSAGNKTNSPNDKNDAPPQPKGSSPLPADAPAASQASEENGPSKLAWSRERLLGYINGLPANRRVSLLAIANTKDQNRLAKLALDDPDGTNRAVAAHALTDQKLLAKLAGEAQDEVVRITAARRLTGEDQPSVLKLLDSTKDTRVRGAALAVVKDPAVRARLEAEFNPAGAAFDKKQAEEEAQKILKAKDSGDRLRAIEVAVNVEVLLKAAMEDPDQQLADKATKRLLELQKVGKKGIDDATFEKLAIGAKTLYPRRTAIKVISNKAVLAKLADDPDDEIRSAVAARIDDAALLAKLAQDPKSNVRFATINRLTDTKLLQELAASDPDASTRKQAERRLDALKGKGKK